MRQRTVAILSAGCAANFGDGEEIGERFAREGFRVSFEMPSETPDAIVLNTCTVKGISGAEKLAHKIWREFPKTPVWVTGCATEDLKQSLTRQFSGWTLGTKDAHQSESAFQDFLGTISPNSLHDSSAPNFPSGSAPELFSHAGVGIVNIEEGCLDACSYCSTRLVKGKLRSATPEFIVRKVSKKIESGAKEIFLTGQDTSCYGFDIGTNLAELLQRIVSRVPGNYKLRIGMGNPRHVLRYLDALLETFEDEHLYKFIHIPVQSGSDKILRAMNRKHSSQDFFTIAEAFTHKFPDLTLGTDIIVAFPGETREDFGASLELVRRTRPSICNITRFVPRTGTFAAKLPGALSRAERHARSAELAKLFQEIALENNRAQIGKEVHVLVEKSGSRPGTTIARDFAYRSVALNGNFAPGTELDVRIRSAETFALIGEIMPDTHSTRSKP